ncbi:hypothetical protein BC834DRAFT_45359 [Gloeopeniophorella convolvens]|nr:hypothetical protein BC834DRAFT_45359 [Gloeopeniophorella convolvens]
MARSLIGRWMGCNISAPDLFFKSPQKEFKPEDILEREQATEKSWNVPFVNASVATKALEDHVVEFMKRSTKIYAPYCPIIQSSGTGKSRLLDEFAKTHLSIPINLRNPNTTGFPPADVNLRRYLTRSDTTSESYKRMYTFLIALSEETAKTLESFGDVDPPERIGLFREYMTKGQSLRTVGEQRRTFYDAVLRRAEKLSKETENSLNEAEENLLKKKVLAVKDVLLANSVNPRKSHVPDIFITFDEAHELMNEYARPLPSNFSELRRVLRMLHGGSSFVFFVSTDSKISEFAPTRPDPSEALPTPFSAIGFDQLMDSHKIGMRFCTIEEVTSVESIAHMGRPLWGSLYDSGSARVRKLVLDFAQAKLLCADYAWGSQLSESQKSAILSQRLPLDINGTRYTDQPTDVTREQVEQHMRICLEVSKDNKYMISAAPSEPILSEAASLIMRSDDPGFFLPQALRAILGSYPINQGDRGGLLVESFFIWARDKVAKLMHKELPDGAASPVFSVKQLLSQLFVRDMQDDTPSVWRVGDTGKTFERIFGDTKMHFSHFAPALETAVFRGEHILGFLSRGAAAMGACCQPGVDMVIPYLYQSERISGSANLGYILVQVKLYGQTISPAAESFRRMDPFRFGLLDPQDPKAGSVPIIRIVFSLGDKTPGFKQVFYDDPSEAAHVLEGEGPSFTSFDYWCSGMSMDTLRPVAESPEAWAALAVRACQWDFSGRVGSAVNKALHTMYPLGEANLMH